MGGSIPGPATRRDGSARRPAATPFAPPGLGPRPGRAAPTATPGGSSPFVSSRGASRDEAIGPPAGPPGVPARINRQSPGFFTRRRHTAWEADHAFRHNLLRCLRTGQTLITGCRTGAKNPRDSAIFRLQPRSPHHYLLHPRLRTCWQARTRREGRQSRLMTSDRYGPTRGCRPSLTAPNTTEKDRRSCVLPHAGPAASDPGRKPSKPSTRSRSSSSACRASRRRCGRTPPSSRRDTSPAGRTRARAPVRPRRRRPMRRSPSSRLGPYPPTRAIASGGVSDAWSRSPPPADTRRRAAEASPRSSLRVPRPGP